MNLRTFDAAAGDADRLSQFRCSTGAPFEHEVETWIRDDAVGWADDLPRARFQRRTLALVEDGEATAAVVAWQDIVRVDLEGIWLEVLAVELGHQHGGQGQAAYELTVDHLRSIERDGDHLADGRRDSSVILRNCNRRLLAGTGRDSNHRDQFPHRFRFEPVRVPTYQTANADGTDDRSQ